MAAPRRKRIYSNRGYELLAALVADRSEMPFDAYLHEAVFEPLGMQDTRLDGSAASAGVSTVDDLLRLTAALDPTAPSSVLATRPERRFRPCSTPSSTASCPATARSTRTRGGLAPRSAAHKQPHWTGSRNSPRPTATSVARGHVPLDRPGGTGHHRRADRPRLRGMGDHRLAGALRRGAPRRPNGLISVTSVQNLSHPSDVVRVKRLAQAARIAGSGRSRAAQPDHARPRQQRDQRGLARR